MSDNFRDYVAEAHEAGYSVVPADMDKRPKVKWKEWQTNDQTPEEFDHLGHGSIWGVVTGAKYGITVLDFDFADGGEETLAALNLDPTVLTPGGAHVYIKHPGWPVKNSARKFPRFPGLDIRGDGGLAWFSGRSKKGVYTPVTWPPEPDLLATLDDELMDLCFPEVIETLAQYASTGDWSGAGHGTIEATRYIGRLIENIITAEKGTSNAVLNKAAFGAGGLIAAGQLDGDWAYDALLDAANDRGAGDPEEVIRASLTAGGTKPWKFDPVDDEWIPVAAYRAFKQGKVPEPSPFPVDVYPPALAAFVRQGAKSTSAPLDYIGAGVLPVLGTAIGGNVSLRMKRKWTESTLLYVTLVGEPSWRKSPAMGLVMGPLYDAVSADRRATQQERDDAGDEYVEVDRPDLFVDDATIEALFGVLQRSPRGVIMAADELDGWVRGMGQYKGGGGRDRQHWLSIWSRGVLKVDRKQAGNNFIEKPYVAILGGIQPDPLEELMHGKNDGLLPRLLMAQGEYVMPFDHDDDMDEDVIDAYDALWNDLRDAGMQDREVEFTSAGREAFRSWVNLEHYPSIKNVPVELAAAWGKMDGQCARLCLILAMIDGTEVTPDVVDRAVALVRYFQGQAGGILQGTTGGSRWEKQYAGRVKTIARFLQDNPAADRTEVMMHGPEWAMDGRLIDRILDDLPEGLWHG